MILFFPLRTSIRPWQTPYANYGLIVANVIIYLIMLWSRTKLDLSHFMLMPVRPYLWQFVSYAFMHASFTHIAGNMFFLYLFGNNVNDKLGHTGYICFYLAGAVFSGIGHTLMSNSPVLGASGAVAAVTGAYLVLFPRTLVTVFYWLLFFVDTIEVPSLYFIGFKLIFWDNIVERRIPNVAYDAHLSGYAFGILAMVGMLAFGLISGSGFDLWTMLKQWNRRRRYRDVTATGHDPYTGKRQAKPVKQVKVKEVKEVKEVKKTAEQRQREKRLQQLRSDIAGRFSEHNLPAAADLYLELIETDSEQLLPRQQLLDIANQLASINKQAESARAYEQFLGHYSNYQYAEQVELMLGVLYSRYLDKPELAKKNLEEAAKKLRDPGQLKMCEDELEGLGD